MSGLCLLFPPIINAASIPHSQVFAGMSAVTTGISEDSVLARLIEWRKERDEQDDEGASSQEE